MSEDMSLEKTGTDHVRSSVGGKGGHILRRGIHLSMWILAWVYYWHDELISDMVGLDPKQIVSILVLLLALIEGVRISNGWTFIGQREYESKQVSALAWGGFAIGITLLLAPPGSGGEPAAYGLPLILTLSFADPAMGEARRAGWPEKRVAFLGGAVASVFWLGSVIFLGAVWWILPVLIPLTIAVERPVLKWIDDNATMVLAPLAFILVCSSFF